MTVEHLELLVEEPSMEAFLRGFLPGVLGDITFEIYPSQCKRELLDKLPQRLRAYAKWLPPTWRLLILVDRDSDDCYELKKRLDDIAENAGLSTPSNRIRNQYSVVNRIAIEELESWYFGDWQGVCGAFPKVSTTIAQTKRYRNPDGIQGGTWEAFERILMRAGYFEGGLRKIETARTLSRHISADRNRSRSFQIFYRSLTEIKSMTNR